MIAGYYRESSLTARQPRRAPHHVIQATTYTSEGLAQRSCVAARVGFEPAIFRNGGTEHHHLATTPSSIVTCLIALPTCTIHLTPRRLLYSFRHTICYRSKRTDI